MSHEDFNFDQRREGILRLALTAAQNRKRKRWVARGVAGVCVLLIAGLIARVRTENPKIVRKIPQATPSAITITFLQTDPKIVERLSLATQTPSWKTIDDEQLLQSLADAGRPSGLIYVDDRAVLLPQ